MSRVSHIFAIAALPVACAGGSADVHQPAVEAPAHGCDARDCAGATPSPGCSAYCATLGSFPLDAGSAGVVVSASGGADAGAEYDAVSSQALPPPKPTTISLASSDGTPADAELVEGDKAFEAGSLADAEKHYQLARTLAPKRVAPMVGLARIRIARVGAPFEAGAAKGNREIMAAVRDLKTAAKADPGFGPAAVELGRALLVTGSADQALEWLVKGVDLLPSEAEAHSALGIGYLATGKKDEAVTELAKAAGLDPGSAARHGNLGTALFMAGRKKEAIAEYELRVRLADGDARAHSDLGTALLSTDDLARATSELQRAVALDPGRATFHSNLGYALQLQGKMDEAVAEYRQALKLDDKLSSAWINLATALAKNPRTRAEARAALERARAIDPTDPRVKPNLEDLDALEKGVAPAQH
jgi:Flp pilus assembly protein TadD